MCGARAWYPSAANRRVTSMMCSFTPHASWTTITPPLASPSGLARYTSMGPSGVSTSKVVVCMGGIYARPHDDVRPPLRPLLRGLRGGRHLQALAGQDHHRVRRPPVL